MWRVAGTIALTGVLLASLCPGVAAADAVNGGFENGDTAGWTVTRPCGTGSGGWFATGSTTTPLNGATISPAPEGDFAAVTDQTGPGTHIMYQNLAVPPEPGAVLSFFLYYRTIAEQFSAPDTLDCATVPNQQYRVDLLAPAAPVDSVAPGDVLAELFRTAPGSPLSLAPTRMVFDLSAFAGQTVRLRFTEVNNQGLFWASADAVRIESTPHTVKFFLHGQDIPGTAGGRTMNLHPGPTQTLTVDLRTAPTWYSDPPLTGTVRSGGTAKLVMPCTLALALAPTFRLAATDLSGGSEQLLGQTSTLLSLCIGQRTVTIPLTTPRTLINQRLKLTISTPLGAAINLQLGASTYLQLTNFTGTP